MMAKPSFSPEPSPEFFGLPGNFVLDTVFDTLPSGLILLNVHGEILRMNQRAKILLGLDMAMPCRSLDNLPDYLAPLKLRLASADSDIHRSEISLQLPTLPEEQSTIGFSLTIIRPTDAAVDTILVFTFTDITQILKDRQAMDKIKDELHQSKKLASIGTMISGVAHELNNPLTGISMSAELSRMNLERMMRQLCQADAASIDAKTVCDKLEKTLQEVTKITRACQKAAALVGDLLSYAKPTQLVGMSTDYGQLVDDTVQALKSHPDFGQFEMSVELPAEPFLVLVDRVKIEQVFYNLCKNACDASEGRGHLKIWFSKSHVPNGTLWAVAHVKDNGPGIDKTVLGRIFDPFFSTKGNKGVGLGLSIAYRTIEQHGGLLSVESHPNQGSEFQVALPLQCL